MKKILLFSLMMSTAMAQEAPSQPAELVLYTTAARGSVEDLVKIFNAQTGSNVTVSRNAKEMATADMLWVSNVLQLDKKEELMSLPTTWNAPYMPADRSYLPQTARYRTLLYSRDRVKPDQLPKSIIDLPKVTALKGKIGWTVSSSSFVDLVAAMIEQYGEAKTRQWLMDMKALEPRDFGNEFSALPNAIHTDQIDVGLTFSNWLARYRPAGYRINNYYFDNGDVGNTAEISAIAIKKSAKDKKKALQLLEFLNKPEAQLYLYTSAYEQPLGTGALTPRTTGITPEQGVGLSSMPAILPYREAAEKLLIDLDIL